MLENRIAFTASNFDLNPVLSWQTFGGLNQQMWILSFSLSLSLAHLKILIKTSNGLTERRLRVESQELSTSYYKTNKSTKEVPFDMMSKQVFLVARKSES